MADAPEFRSNVKANAYMQECRRMLVPAAGVELPATPCQLSHALSALLFTR